MSGVAMISHLNDLHEAVGRIGKVSEDELSDIDRRISDILNFIKNYNEYYLDFEEVNEINGIINKIDSAIKKSKKKLRSRAKIYGGKKVVEAESAQEIAKAPPPEEMKLLERIDGGLMGLRERLPPERGIERENLSISTVQESDLPRLKPALHSIFDTDENKTDAEEAYTCVESWLNQKRLNREGKIDEKKLPYDLEYSVMKKGDGKILAISGLYTVQTSAPGFDKKEGTSEVARLGWFGVVKDERLKGYGKLMLDSEMQKAKEKGASVFLIETSTLEKEAHRLYEKSGLKSDVNVKDYYGKGVDMHCLYRNIDNFENKSAAKTVENYDVSKLSWLKSAFGESKFAWLSDTIEKAKYAKDKRDVVSSLIQATPYSVEEKGTPVGFGLLSRYEWGDELTKATRATFVAAEAGKEQEVAAAITQEAKELGTRTLVVEMPEGENGRLESAFAGLGFSSSQTIKDLYTTYDANGTKESADQVIFARNISEF